MAALHAGDIVAERYEIEAIGATGGMGTVYRARDRETGNRVALKLLSSTDLRLAREVNAIAALDHPAVVRYIDHRRDKDRVFVVMEWLEGIDVAARLKQGPLAVMDAMALLECVAGGLAAMHARGIVHRDIKPRNVMLIGGDSRRAVIVDFGIARREEDTAVTLGAIVGTPRYMAPEQATGSGVGPRADVYSLGCVIFECLTGQPPFAGPDAISVMAAKVMANPPRVRDVLASVPPALDVLLDRMLAREPSGRPADGAALVGLLPAVAAAIAAVTGARDAAVAITRQETKIATVILARAPKATNGGETVEIVSESDLEPIVGAMMAARAATLPDGTMVVSIDEPAELVDRVAMAGRSARQLAKQFPSMHVALATGPLTATTAGCAVIDRATALLARAGGRVWLDEVSAELLARTHRIEREVDTEEMRLARLRAASQVSDVVSTGEVTAANRPRALTPPTGIATGNVRALTPPAGVRITGATTTPPAGVRITGATTTTVGARTGDERVRAASYAASEAGVPWLGDEHAEVGAQARDRPAPFVGRERERRMLAAVAEACLGIDRAASAAIVVGESGLGKSRLVREVISALGGDVRALAIGTGGASSSRRVDASAGAMSFALWTVRADPMAAGAPYALLAQLVRALVGLDEDLEGDAERRHRIACTVALHVAKDQAKADRIIAALGAMLDEKWAAAPEHAAARQDLIRRGWEDWVASVAAQRALVIAIDDLHLADATSLAVVDGMLRACRNLPLLVLGTARPEVATAHPRLWESRGVQTIALAPLADRAATTYLDEVVPDLSDEQRARIIEHAGGSPFLLEELARAAATSTDRSAPVAAVAIVQARLDRLAPELRRVLRAASVFGRDFVHGGVAAVLAPIEDRELADALRALEVAEVIEIVDDAGTPAAHAQFRHDLVRDAAYAALPERDRALAHRRAAAWLAEREGIAPAVIAYHFAAATMADEATHWWARACAQAAHAWDMAAVLRFGALAAPGLRGVELGALEELRATAFRWHGQLEEAEASAAVAVRELPERDPRWFAAFSTRLCMRCLVGNTEGTDVMIRALAEAALADGSDHAALAVGKLLAQLMLNDAAFDRAHTQVLESVFAQVLALGPLDKSDELAIVIADVAGEHAIDASDYATALRLGIQVFEREARRGNSVPAQQQLSINGYYMYELGQMEAAKDALESALAFARDREVARLEAHAHHNLGIVMAALGDLSRAAAHERRAFDYYSLQQDGRMVAGCRMYLALILIAQDELVEAEREVREALAALAGSRYGGLAWATLARVLLGQGRVEEAATAIEAATTDTRSSEGWAWIAVTDAEISLRRGQRGRARAIVERAYAELERRMAATAFADPRWQHAYTTNVAAHRRLLALRAELESN